jgi:prepilin-type N-terminal cleavage/methylation domain-containing protein
MMRDRGVTLIELLIVVSIIVILVAALGFSFNGWQAGYNVESQMKNIYSDLMNARMGAMERNRSYFVSLAATQYTIYEDNSPWPDGDRTLEAADRQVSQTALDPRYTITWSNSGDPAPQVVFDSQGIANGDREICSNSDADTDYNCIEIAESGIDIGKLKKKLTDGGSCDPANCVSK